MTLPKTPLLISEEVDVCGFPERLAHAIRGQEALQTPILVLASEVAKGSACAWTGSRGANFQGAAVLTSKGQLELAAIQPQDFTLWAKHLAPRLSLARTIGGEAQLVELLLREWEIDITSALNLRVFAAKQPTGQPGTGTLNRAQPNEVSVASKWLSGFFHDTLQGHPSWIGEAAKQLIDNGDLYFWREKDTPVSMVAVVAVTKNATRLSLAYTPSNLRGRGYATSCMQALTNRLLKCGAVACCVHVRSDAETPNRLYRRAGYTMLGERLEGAIW